MAAEAQHAPRVPRDRSSMADAAAAVRAGQSPTLGDQIATFRFNETYVFGHDRQTLIDGALQGAHSVGIALSILMNSSDSAAIYHHHVAGVVDAINMLVGLAATANASVEA